jgi:hypothetical protein
MIMANEKKVKQERKVVPVSELKEFPNNPNIHPKEQVEAIAKSMETYGQYYPIIVDEKMQILCGHGKKLALEMLGKTDADVVIMHGLSDKQKMKLVLEDNKIQSLSYVNFGKVEDIIREIGETNIIGFADDYLEAIISEVSTDNMGVDFTQPAQKKSVEEIPTQKQEEQHEEFEDIESGMQSARTMVCPHCGKEITL